jgi:hypothetical protein
MKARVPLLASVAQKIPPTGRGRATRQRHRVLVRISSQAPAYSPATASDAHTAQRLVAVVEVVPLVAGAAPVIVRGGVVGAVVGVLGLLVQGAGLGVLDERLGVEVGGLLSVEDGAHLRGSSHQDRQHVDTRRAQHASRCRMPRMKGHRAASPD